MVRAPQGERRATHLKYEQAPRLPVNATFRLGLAEPATQVITSSRTRERRARPSAAPVEPIAVQFAPSGQDVSGCDKPLRGR